jgi:type I restriction enzyme S subunit
MKQTLGQIAIVTMGQSPSSEYYNTNRDGLPFLQGCTTFGRLYPTYDIWSSFYNKEAFPGDILFTVRAPVGDVNMCKDHIAIGRGLASIKAVNVLPKYLFYLLQANKHQFQFASSGTIYQSINRDKLLGVELNVHSRDEQEHIVGTIGSVDDLIENIDKRVNCLNKILADSLSGFYEKVPFSYYNPKLVKTGIESFQGEKIYLDTSCVEGTNPIDYSYLITEDQRPSRANMQPKERTAWTARMKESYKVLGITEVDCSLINQTILSTGFIGVEESDYLPLAFLYSLFISEDFRKKKDLSSTGATMEAINNKDFLNLAVPLLSAQEVGEYKAKYNPLLLELSSLREQKERLKKEKKLLLAKYFH